jgi:hypothetical protein
MSPVIALGLSLLAAGLAYLADRVICLFVRRYQSDGERIKDATDGLKHFQRAIDYLFERKSVTPVLKAFFLELAELIPERQFAQHLILPRAQSTYQPDDWANRVSAELSELERTDPEAYEASFVALRTAIVASILQWPETAQHLSTIFVRLAAQRKSDALYSAAEGRRRVHHDRQFGPAVAYA